MLLPSHHSELIMNASSRFLSALLLIVMLVRVSSAETIARCGDGWLEKIDGLLVLHVKGSPYEMGYQHGVLLKDHCRENFNFLLGEKAKDLIGFGKLKLNPRFVIDSIVKTQKQFIPPHYFEEMKGLAEGAGLTTEDIEAANFIPELFHCSGFAVMDSATKDGTLYHGRVLDYACDWKLQEHAVIVVAEPDEGIPFVNVTYAGFVGSVTGMNLQKVSIGEMGGPGLGHWRGVPMAILMREVLQTAKNISDAVAVFENNPRTCVYYYVIADGKTNEALGMATNWEKMITIGPGEAHQLLPIPVRDAVLLSAGDRYKTLAERVQGQHGELDAESALRLMDRPVAMSSNLHNVLFEPASTKFWVAHASADGQPAATQPYHAFQLTQLLRREPASGTPVIPLVANTK